MSLNSLDGTRSISSSVRGTRTQKKIRDLLEELAALERGDFHERFGNDKGLPALLATIGFDEIDHLLREAGIDREENPEQWHAIYGTFRAIKAETDPHGYGEWILGSDQDHSLPHVYRLGANDPEMGVDVIQRSDVSARLKATCYNALFQRAAEHDPERAVRLFNATEFKTADQEGMALLGTFGFSSEIATPDKVREIVTAIPEETLNAHPTMVKTLGGFFSQRPAEEVLARFPLDGQPWERTVAIWYLERRAFLGYTGDEDIGKILASDQARLLSEQEIGRLNAILGK